MSIKMDISNIAFCELQLFFAHFNKSLLLFPVFLQCKNARRLKIFAQHCKAGALRQHFSVRKGRDWVKILFDLCNLIYDKGPNYKTFVIHRLPGIEIFDRTMLCFLWAKASILTPASIGKYVQPLTADLSFISTSARFPAQTMRFSMSKKRSICSLLWLTPDDCCWSAAPLSSSLDNSPESDGCAVFRKHWKHWEMDGTLAVSRNTEGNTAPCWAQLTHTEAHICITEELALSLYWVNTVNVWLFCIVRCSASLEKELFYSYHV